MKIRERKSQNPCQDTSEGDTNYVGQSSLGMQNGLIIGVVAVRLLNIFFPITSFVPDEYWQALEVAHRLAFGYPFYLGCSYILVAINLAAYQHYS